MIEFHGPDDLVYRLHRKRKLLEAGDSQHRSIRTVLLILGGLMRGASGGGALLALSRLRLTNAFDHVVGISTGALAGSYLLPSFIHAKTGFGLYYYVAQNIITIWPRPVFDFDGFEHVLRESDLLYESDMRLDVDAVRKARPELHVVVTNKDTRETELLNAKAPGTDMIGTIIKSLMLPGDLCDRAIVDPNDPYVDGGVKNPFPVSLVLNTFEPTDVLVVANRKYTHLRRAMTMINDHVASRYLMGDEPPQVGQMLRQRERLFAEGYRTLIRQPSLRSGIIWSCGILSFFTRSPQKIRAARDRAYRETRRCFSEG